MKVSAIAVYKITDSENIKKVLDNGFIPYRIRKDDDGFYIEFYLPYKEPIHDD